MIEAVSVCLIGPKSWNRSVELLKPIWIVRDCPQIVWVANDVIYAINCVLVCMRPGMAMDFGFTRWN